jgi:hypothetical protein
VQKERKYRNLTINSTVLLILEARAIHMIFPRYIFIHQNSEIFYTVFSFQGRNIYVYYIYIYIHIYIYIYITCFVVVDNKVLNTSIIVEQDIFIS